MDSNVIFVRTMYLATDKVSRPKSSVALYRSSRVHLLGHTRQDKKTPLDMRCPSYNHTCACSPCFLRLGNKNNNSYHFLLLLFISYLLTKYYSLKYLSKWLIAFGSSGTCTTDHLQLHPLPIAPISFNPLLIEIHLFINRCLETVCGQVGSQVTITTFPLRFNCVLRGFINELFIGPATHR